MQIEIVTKVDDELYEAFQRLIPQLTKNPARLSRDGITALVKSTCSTLLVERADDGTIIGVLCLTVYRVPTGIRSIIEDVIVDESARGQGIGEALTRCALEVAKEAGAAHVTLTSNPKREAANRLYQRMGFARRETNAYIYKF
ncbi:MAG: GNAT family N-acetyltransferase [Anaerolineales bacterium]|nr:GNAT family N-acetyltransferase [Anaerolineales bacterium]